MMEATIKELWQEYTRKYLAKFGEYPRVRITSRDAIIIAILDLNSDTPDDTDYDFD
jgi:hypothetical protein